MPKTNRLLLPILAFTIMATANAYGQSCTSCGGGGNFGYPGVHSRHAERHAARQARRTYNQKITARNDAWPKPFACIDKQTYFAAWGPMIDAGFENQCVLMPRHFDPVTHELNEHGRHTVAGIMQNMPSHRKQVFIYRDADPSISEARMKNVRSTIETYYSQIAPNAMVALSNQTSPSIPGRNAEGISRQYIEGAPAPIIPVSNGSETISSSVGQ